MPLAFLDINLPKIVKDSIKGMVLDERCWTELVHYADFPLETFSLPRRKPYVTKKEAAVDLTPDDLLVDRDKAGEIVTRALREGRDPAAALHGFSMKPGDKVITGKELAESAKKVCGRASDNHMSVYPNMPPKAVEVLVTNPKGTNINEERRFWTLIIDRIAAMDSVLSSTRAKGNRDYRIQLRNSKTRDGLRRKDASVRISWRTDSDLMGLPTLMMDATADEEIVRKVWTGRNVDVVRITAPLHQRVLWCNNSTFSDSSLLPRNPDDDSTEARKRALSPARNLVYVRHVASAMCGLFGFGRVLVNSNKSVRVAMAKSWKQPANMDSLHNGAAMGLDFAKGHAAMLNIGRMEMPVWIVDAIVAALTYDDTIPEEPVDRTGNGFASDGEDLKIPKALRKVMMRDGSDVTHAVPEYEGFWANRVQRQYREENTMQAIGRLQAGLPRRRAAPGRDPVVGHPQWADRGRDLPFLRPGESSQSSGKSSGALE